MLWFFINPGRKGYVYYHDDDDELGIWATIAILLTILAVYTGVVHLLDYLTFDAVPWWVEPFTIIPVVIYTVLVSEFGFNPLHWWPLCWGTRVTVKGDIEIDERELKRLGGPLQVYREDWETLRFRRKRDAFAFMVFRNL
jgi:hypothetical protein